MSKRKVTIIDYGMGNIWSVYSAFKYLDCEVRISSNFQEIRTATTLILPGVGSFNRAVESLHGLNLFESIRESVLECDTKILGICLGMQLLAESSTEDGLSKGLNLIPGKVDKFSESELKSRKLPHVGFDNVQSHSESKLFQDFSENKDFYFVHSYRMLPTDLPGRVATCSYKEDFLAAYEMGNVFATQFHPEKSQTNGLRLLKNFLEA